MGIQTPLSRIRTCNFTGWWSMLRVAGVGLAVASEQSKRQCMDRECDSFETEPLAIRVSIRGTSPAKRWKWVRSYRDDSPVSWIERRRWTRNSWQKTKPKRRGEFGLVINVLCDLTFFFYSTQLWFLSANFVCKLKCFVCVCARACVFDFLFMWVWFYCAEY